MTRKDYERVATVLRQYHTTNGQDRAMLQSIMEGLAMSFRAENPNFSATKFFTACGFDYEEIRG